MVLRVYVDGVFDLFHYGHAEMFKRVRESFSEPIHLLVGPSLDTDCKAYKRLPIMRHEERCRSVSHCKYVDEIIYDAPWVIDQAFLDKYAIDFVCHDSVPYPMKGPKPLKDVYEYVKTVGKFKHVPRTEGVSTTLLEHLVLLKNGMV